MASFRFLLRPCRQVATAVLALLASQAAAEAFAPGQTDFLVGVEAYHAGDYSAALDYFRDARAAGFRDHNLDVNLGLSYYKLARYAEARAMFEPLLADPGYADIAEFHLGLIAARSGQQQLALSHLRRAKAMARSPKLQALAQIALERLGAEPPPAPRGPTFYVSGGLGYDSNPVLLSDSSGQPNQGPDWYGEVIGSYRHTLAARAAWRDELRGSVYLRQYHRDTDLSQQTAELGARHSIFGSGWQAGLGVLGQTYFVGGGNLQNFGGAELEGSSKFPAGTLSAHYRGGWVAGGDGFTYLDGWRHFAGLNWSLPLWRGALRADYEFETNDRRNLVAATEFFSESPVRHGAGLRLEQAWGGAVTLEARAGYRYSRYRDPDTFMLNGALVTQRRVENLAEFGASVRLQLGREEDLLLQYDYSHNRSDISTFAYSRHVAAIAFEWLK